MRDPTKQIADVQQQDKMEATLPPGSNRLHVLSATCDSDITRRVVQRNRDDRSGYYEVGCETLGEFRSAIGMIVQTSVRHCTKLFRRPDVFLTQAVDRDELFNGEGKPVNLD
jgi:hypothetical protein